MAITQQEPQRVKEGKWYDVYNRRKRLVGSWKVMAGQYRSGKPTGKFFYKGFVYDKDMNIIWDLTGDNGEYPTAIEAAKAAIVNILHPD